MMELKQTSKTKVLFGKIYPSATMATKNSFWAKP